MSPLQAFVWGVVLGATIMGAGVWVGVWVEARLFRGSDA
jgi:hypothetical protein